MVFKRSSGILLHLSSLPSRYGIGDLGPKAYEWVDFLNQTNTKVWQILPLGPTGYGDSPYQCLSAFAGNPYLISPHKLFEDGLLMEDDLTDVPDFPKDTVDYGWVIPWKLELLEKAYLNFLTAGILIDEFEIFRNKQSAWLDDYSVYMALKEIYEGRPWVEWPAELRDREERALEQVKIDHVENVRRQAFYQYLFFRQWNQLRAYANKNDVKIIGDVPIYMAHDCADVWGNPELYYLNDLGKPTVVAGVPPDGFSSKGQLWGNPLYRWDVHKQDGYQWWIKRMQATFQMVDIVRLDHFRGFAGYWEVPEDHENAIGGKWLPGPSDDLFGALKNALGDMPVIAEDLGMVTPDVEELRSVNNFPGMKILEYGFDGSLNNPHHPEKYIENSIAYTGTHDNEPLVGWFENLDHMHKVDLLNYLGTDGSDIAWEIIRNLWNTNPVIVIAQLQDFLRSDNLARMNYPSSPDGNWRWRMQVDSLNDETKSFLSGINQENGRG